MKILKISISYVVVFICFAGCKKDDEIIQSPLELSAEKQILSSPPPPPHTDVLNASIAAIVNERDNRSRGLLRSLVTGMGEAFIRIVLDDSDFRVLLPDKLL